MNPRSASSLLFLSFFLLFLSSATSFNITKILNQYPDFSTFNGYLTQTQLAYEINRRQTITVLVVDNDSLSSLSGQSTDVIKKVMSLHVVLDYYDVEKLQKLSKKTALLTTLFQSSGVAANQQGFLNVTDLETGEVAFGSAVNGSKLGANLVKLVAAQPYNISVLQISSAIIPNGIENANTNSTSSSPPTQAPKSSNTSTSPTASPTKTPPVPAASPTAVDAPAPSDDDTSDAPSDADAPSEADAPSADSPESSPPIPSDAEGPRGESPDQAPGSSEKPSSGTRMAFGTCLAVIIVGVSSWVTL